MIRRSKERIAFEVFLYPFLVVVGLICLYPVWEVFVTSILPYGDYLSSTIHLVPTSFTTTAYEIIFRQPNVVGSLLNSVYITVFGTTLSLLVTIPAAYALSKSYLKGQRLFLFLAYFTVLFEGGIIPLYFVVKNLGMLNTLWALMIPQLIFTYYLIIMRAFFVSFPASLEEAARMEGYNDLRILVHIVVPLSKPVIAAIGLFYAVLRWNDFFQAMLFLSKRELWPVQLLVHHLTSPDTDIDPYGGSLALGPDKGVSAWSINMAAVALAVVPIILVYPFIQKYFSKGILIGSLKE